MQRLTLLVTLGILGAWIPVAPLTNAHAQEDATPPEGAVWFKPPGQGPLIQPNEWRNWRRNNQIKFQNALRAASPTPAELKELELGSKVYTDRLTDPEERKDLPNVTNELLNRVNQFGKGDARKAILEDLTRDLSNLFRQKERIVRINAAIFLGRLDSEPAPLSGGKEAVRYWPAYKPLIGAIEDPNQDLATKLAAAVGLRDILALSDIPRRERDDVIVRLCKQLDVAVDPANWPQGPVQREYYWSFPFALIEAVRNCKASGTLARDPVPVQSLVSIVVDSQQDWRVRARSLRAVSELPLEEDNSFEIGNFAKLSAWLMNEAVRDFQASPNESHWRQSISDIYFSFRPEKRAEAQAGFGWEAKSDMAKFRGSAADVAGAFDAIRPIMIAVAPASPVALPRLDNDVVSGLKIYVSENSADKQQVHPRIPALDLKSPQPAANENATDSEPEPAPADSGASPPE